MVLKVRAPMKQSCGLGHEVDLMNPKSQLISFVSPGTNAELLQRLTEKQISTMAVDCIPRLTKAQSFDALSSMSNIAGFRAVVEAANVSVIHHHHHLETPSPFVRVFLT